MEKRKSERSSMPSQLTLKRLDDNSGMIMKVNVSDVSRTGIGFDAHESVDIGVLLETDMEIWTKDTIHVFLEIVRKERRDMVYQYGAIFIGLSEMDAARIGVYQTFEKVEKAEREALMAGMSLE